MIQKTVEVALGERSHRIFVGEEMLSSLAPTLEQHGLSKNLVVVSDTRVAALYLKPLQKHLAHFGWGFHSVVVPVGEQQKSLTRANRIYTEMLKAGIRRTSPLIALGGGVVGDLAGFVAATYHRGMPLIHIPTTLLAQVDSSVGGKVAVNHPLGKNMIGVFHQPSMVWTDSAYLRTLPKREIVCGLGEIVKYGILADSVLFQFIESHLEEILELHAEPTRHVIARCLEIKADIVSRDERETGIRTLLNLGHTVGHALEAAGKYRLVKHGEAVLFGLLAESSIAAEMGIINRETQRRIEDLIGRIPIQVRIEKLRKTDILRVLSRDKKAIGKSNRFVFPARIGEAKVVEGVDSKLITDSLKYLRSL